MGSGSSSAAVGTIIVPRSNNVTALRAGGGGGNAFSWGNQEPITSIAIRAEEYLTSLIINNRLFFISYVAQLNLCRYTLGNGGHGGISNTINMDNNECILKAHHTLVQFY